MIFSVFRHFLSALSSLKRGNSSSHTLILSLIFNAVNDTRRWIRNMIGFFSATKANVVSMQMSINGTYFRQWNKRARIHGLVDSKRSERFACKLPQRHQIHHQGKSCWMNKIYLRAIKANFEIFNKKKRLLPHIKYQGTENFEAFHWKLWGEKNVLIFQKGNKKRYWNILNTEFLLFLLFSWRAPMESHLSKGFIPPTAKFCLLKY